MTAATLPAAPAAPDATPPDRVPVAPPTRAPVLGVPATVDPETRTLEVVLSTRRRDRQGDVVEPAGLDFSGFLRNPVVLWAHDQSRPPVGRVLAVVTEADTVTATVQFAETTFAREVFDLYREGYLRAWSIGFVPRRWERLAAEGNAAPGFHVLEAEVVEVSAVPVPANPEALTRALTRLENRTLRAALQSAREVGAAAASRLLPVEEILDLTLHLADRLAADAARKALHAARGALA